MYDHAVAGQPPLQPKFLVSQSINYCTERGIVAFKLFFMAYVPSKAKIAVQAQQLPQLN